jgi:hypothetical protein
MTDFDLSKYIYWEYSVAVLLITEVLRALLIGIDAKVIRIIVKEQPKWLSLIVATILAMLDWWLISQSFHLWQFTISFGLAVLGYDYGFKILKERLLMPVLDWFKSLKENKPTE